VSIKSEQTLTSFSDKWENNRKLAFAETSDESSSIFRWILTRNGFSSPAELRAWLSTRTRILDAGCGNGRVTALLRTYAPEAAEIDGATWWQKIWHVTLPLCGFGALFGLAAAALVDALPQQIPPNSGSTLRQLEPPAVRPALQLCQHARPARLGVFLAESELVVGEPEECRLQIREWNPKRKRRNCWQRRGGRRHVGRPNVLSDRQVASMEQQSRRC
jgi:hypothetical protein